MKYNIFLVYRRADTGVITGRTFDRLCNAFEREQIFVDIDSIPVGCDFVDYLERAIKACRVMVVMMGNNWLGFDDSGGRRRIDLPLDYLRLELEMAIKHGVNLVPVLIDGASMPRRADLPESIGALADQAPIVLNNRSFGLDYPSLQNKLHELVGSRQPSAPVDRTTVTKPISSDHLFVSYAREDIEFTKRLADSLEAEGIPVWMDSLGVKTGASWVHQIEDALKVSKAVILVMSPSSNDSEVVQDELSLALDLKKQIFPVRIAECEAPLRLRRLQYAEFSATSYERALRRLVFDLRESLRLGTPHAEPAPGAGPGPQRPPVGWRKWLAWAGVMHSR
jgi:hypothetical protein